VKNLYEENFDTIHYIENALRAQALYKRDKEYIVRDGQVIIVDEHTGRLMPGRRYGNGLHQAIEAKEGVKIQQESRTLATISLQNYFRMYQKLAGMTGTAATEAEEFRKIYKMEVLVVPTNKEVRRRDESDLVYKTAAGKYSALAGEVEEINKMGRPILIGTRSIEHNQIVARLLSKKGIKHEVLNAKNNEKEAFIIAQAGMKGAITVATNIAGRGVDIVLGGAKPEIKDFRLKIGKYDHKKYEAALAKWKKQNQEVVKLGGLAILGAERHESRRIDNQLRGRSGRQGDPGSSRFYVALEDEIMRIFGGEQIAKLMDILKIDESQPIEAQMVNKSIESAQTKVEGFFFDQRQRLVEFDDVMNRQREIIYKRRRRFLELSGKDLIETAQNETVVAEQTLRGEILSYFDRAIKTNIAAAWAQIDETGNFRVVAEALVKFLVRLIPFDEESQNNLRKRLETLGNDEGKIEKELQQIIRQTYQAREEAMGREVTVEVEKQIMLGTIDQLWMDHLDAIEDLRQGIWMRGDKNTVVSEYKKEAFGLFESLIARIEQTVMERVFRVQVKPQVLAQQRLKEQMEMMARARVSAGNEGGALLEQAQREEVKEVSDNSAGALLTAIKKQTDSPARADWGEIKQTVKKVGRNDPCPCGSGLKYKKCHGKAE
jgi:preprotein translocase subunit SecA